MGAERAEHKPASSPALLAVGSCLQHRTGYKKAVKAEHTNQSAAPSYAGNSSA